MDIGFTECASCNVPFLSSIFAGLDGAAVVFHTPNGCASPYISISRNARKESGRKIPILTSDLTECDFILGSEEKLKETIAETISRFSPLCVFITANCSSGVNARDIQNFIDKNQKYFRVPLVTLVCEWDKPKAWPTGFDCQEHDLLKTTVPYPEAVGNFYNVIDFSGACSIRPILERMGTHWNFITRPGSFENWRKMGRARGTFCLSGDRFSSSIARRLERDFGVPFHPTPLPYGFKATKACLLAIADEVNRREIVEAMIRKEKAQSLARVQDAREILRGKTCLFIARGLDARVENAMLEMLRETGIAIVGDGKGFIASSAMDESPAGLYGADGLGLSSVPGFVASNVVRELRPDLILAYSRDVSIPTPYRAIPSLLLPDEGWQGFTGFSRLAGKMAQIIRQENFLNLSAYGVMPYSPWWERQRIFAGIGDERI